MCININQSVIRNEAYVLFIYVFQLSDMSQLIYSLLGAAAEYTFIELGSPNMESEADYIKYSITIIDNTWILFSL